MKILLLFLFTLFVVFSCKKDFITISGEFDSDEGDKFCLENIYTGHKDTINLEKGKFEFKLNKLIHPQKYVLYPLKSSNKFFPTFFVENTDIHITSKKKSTIPSFSFEIEGGGEVQKEYKKYLLEIDSFYGKKGKKHFYREYQQAARNDSLLFQKLLIKQREVSSIDSEFQQKYIQENPKSFVTLDIIFFNRGLMMIQHFEDYFKKVDKSITDSYQFKMIKKTYEDKKNKPHVGSQVPDFVINDINNKPLRISDEYKRGKYLLIEFWASWCAPCREENPNLIRQYTKYNQKGFNILGISLDSDKEAWKRAVEEDKLLWPQISNLEEMNNKLARDYGVSSVPYNMLVDNTGRVIAMMIAGENLNNKLKELFKE